jgi:hypothetical protein
MFKKKSFRETHHVSCLMTFFENLAVFETMCINIVEPGKPQQYGACAHRAGYLRLHTHTHIYIYIYTPRICNTYYFSTVTMVARTRLDVTL